VCQCHVSFVQPDALLFFHHQRCDLVHADVAEGWLKVLVVKGQSGAETLLAFGLTQGLVNLETPIKGY